MKEIKITKKLYNRLDSIGESKYDEPYQNELYLLGKNKKGIFTDAVEIECDAWDENGKGCEFMPGADKEQITEAYIALAKKKLIPAGFGHVTFWGIRARREDAKWPYIYGRDIYRHKGMPFVRFADSVRAFVCLKRKIIELSIKVV